jgi:hypothetical protein
MRASVVRSDILLELMAGGRMKRRALAFLTATCLWSGCGGVTSPSQNDVELFSGTLEVGGRNVHQFNVDRNGEFEVKITALSPNQDAVIGVSYGRVQGDACGVLQTNFALLNRVALGGFITSGQYCLSVVDVGSITAPENYTVRVSHP